MNCIHFLTIMNNAAMNIYVQVFVWTYVFIYLGYTLGVELLGHMITLYLNFQGTARLFSKVTASFYIPSKQHMRALIFPHPYQHLLLLVFWSKPS